MYGMGIAQSLGDSEFTNSDSADLQLDAINLTSRWKIRFRQNVQVQKNIFIKHHVLITNPLDHSGKIYSRSNYGIIQKYKIKFAPINLYYSFITKDKFRPFGASYLLRAISLEAPVTDIYMKLT